MNKTKDFRQNDWDKFLESDLERLLQIAVSEDGGTVGDLTSSALIPQNAQGAATIHVREDGVVAGIQAIPTVLKAIDSNLSWGPMVVDGDLLPQGARVGTIEGPARSLLTAERLVLNLLGRLSGIATLTRRYVETVAGTTGRIYDTRKTTLGWRRLEKYAVRCGGGQNHRTGLYDAILIKDNHLAFGREGGGKFSPYEAVIQARAYLEKRFGSSDISIVEIEVDTLEQLQEVLAAKPDIVLLDNMSPATMKEAVSIRNRIWPGTELEASGGINLSTVRAVAETRVERISVGALTHSSISLDLGLDW